MRYVARGQRVERVVEGAVVGATLMALRAWSRGEDPRIGAVAGALALGAAQANHRLRNRANGSQQNWKIAEQVSSLMHHFVQASAPPLAPAQGKAPPSRRMPLR
jgi:hypothetical protein